MDTQELVEILTTWIETYKETSAAGKDNDPKWRENMMKFAAVMQVVESLKDTPAQKVLENAVRIAKEKDSSKIEELYKLLCGVESYLNDSLAV